MSSHSTCTAPSARSLFPLLAASATNDLRAAAMDDGAQALFSLAGCLIIVESDLDGSAAVFVYQKQLFLFYNISFYKILSNY